MHITNYCSRSALSAGDLVRLFPPSFILPVVARLVMMSPGSLSSPRRERKRPLRAKTSTLLIHPNLPRAPRTCPQSDRDGDDCCTNPGLEAETASLSSCPLPSFAHQMTWFRMSARAPPSSVPSQTTSLDSHLHLESNGPQFSLLTPLLDAWATVKAAAIDTWKSRSRPFPGGRSDSPALCYRRSPGVSIVRWLPGATCSLLPHLTYLGTHW